MKQHTTPLDPPQLSIKSPTRALTTALKASPPWVLPAVLSALLVLVFLTTVPLKATAQTWLAYLLLGLLLTLRFFRNSEVVRIALYTLAAFVAVRYFWWRSFHTLGWHGLESYVCALLLYAAEVYGLIIFLLGMFTNVHPIRRRDQPLQGRPEAWPTVDVLIPTYNEEPSLVELTIVAATQMRYPADRHIVWVCDDGGTTQRLNHSDPEVAQAAAARAAELKELCEKYGARYMARERNERAKAGNLNAALARTDGQIIMILDADHIPAADFLERTVGHMQVDPMVFLVQTPHFFVNPDPFEKNHGVFGRVPGENEMFYHVIQPGLDFWNSAFFCGSAALLRRRHLMMVGGISGMSITEDAETALDLHARGFKSVYLDRPLISGLQPETYASFVTQRVRWAQGMIQIFLLKNPLLNPGLRWYQKLNYFSTTFFWFFGFARLIFLFAPVAYLVFGLKIYDANLTSFVAYAVPYVVASIVISDFLYGHVRWTFVSEVYELLQSLYTGPGILRVLRRPRAPAFAVTPKGEFSDRDFISSLTGPFYVIYIITAFAMLCGVARWIAFPEDRAVIGITMFWETLNFLIVSAAYGVLYERRQRRSTPRMPANIEGELTVYGRAPAGCRVVDLSVGGASIEIAKDQTADVAVGDTLVLSLPDPAAKCVQRVEGTVASMRPAGQGRLNLGFRYRIDSAEAQRVVVSLAHGNSQRWVEFQRGRDRHPGLLGAFFFLLSLGLRFDGRIVMAFWADFSARLQALWNERSPFSRPRPLEQTP